LASRELRRKTTPHANLFAEQPFKTDVAFNEFSLCKKAYAETEVEELAHNPQQSAKPVRSRMPVVVLGGRSSCQGSLVDHVLRRLELSGYLARPVTRFGRRRSSQH
jgi:hypothetical protein